MHPQRLAARWLPAHRLTSQTLAEHGQLAPSPLHPQLARSLPALPAAPPCRRHFGLALDPRCVYELDSSTPAKFSRHLTVRLPGHAFATNHAMGKFVGQVSRGSLEARTAHA